ncbi:MAG: zf-TFIIB domain-containing protein [Pseudomonadota bacterium]|uniref:TFIIB-type zinc ribbon-containing protein n=1 Tax=Polaromonas sp. TaxID=1869339 RepID=UPI00185D9935|nr:zf-TFIIB domain-containing protein [Polaromonas sp.]MBA3592796.1 zf-TFIIB domain-containing protein [Polaromonas sp.]MDQ3272501.1 zf-TFIIB domain-containing protein [Pseudomonadota bacterium]
MKCPHCPDATLLMSERQGVEIDYCPQCRGVWLDRGELDKLIALSAAPPVPAPPPVQHAPQSRQPDFVDSDYRHRQRGYPRKQKSWLGEIFD